MRTTFHDSIRSPFLPNHYFRLIRCSAEEDVGKRHGIKRRDCRPAKKETGLIGLLAVAPPELYPFPDIGRHWDTYPDGNYD
jgi:hypothetical protein